MKNQVTKLLFMNVFFASLPYYFVSLLLLREFGFSYSFIAFLGLITEIFGTVFDIPMSFLAKKLGYQRYFFHSSGCFSWLI